MKIIKSDNLSFKKVPYGDFETKILIEKGEIPNLYRLGEAVFKKGQKKEDHGHGDAAEVWIIKKGKGIAVFNQKETAEIQAGDVIITQKEETHSIENPNDEDLELTYFEVKS